MSSVTNVSAKGSSTTPPAIPLVGAIRSGMVNPISGEVKISSETGEVILPLTEAMSKGIIETTKGATGGGQIQGLTLSDCLRKGLVLEGVGGGGRIVDRYSGKNLKVSEAIKRGVVNGDRLEIYDALHNQKITLQEALNCGIIDEINGTYTFTVNDKKSPPIPPISFYDAHDRKCIYNPMTLKECDDNELITKDNKFKNIITGQHGNSTVEEHEMEIIPLLKAVAFGLIDVDLKSVKNVKSGQYVSLGEAIQNNIILPNGEFRDTSTDEIMSLAEAVKKGYLMTVYLKSIFDIEGIKDQEGGDYISFHMAVDNGTIDLADGMFLDQNADEKISIQEASKRRLIQVQLLDMLGKPIGINGEKKRDISLLDAVFEGRLDPQSGLPIDPATSKIVSMEKALQSNLITPRGAAVLKSLLNITVTTATVTQTVRRQLSSSSRTDDITEDITGTVGGRSMVGGTDRTTISFTQSGDRMSRGSSVSSLTATTERRTSATYASASSSSVTATRSSSFSRKASSERKTSTAVSHKDSQSTTAKVKKTSKEGKSIPSVSSEKLHHATAATCASSESNEWRIIPITVDAKAANDVDPQKVIEIPPRGFTLKEVIAKQWFNPVQGVLVFPGAETHILFKECIECCYIDYQSATVISSVGSTSCALNLKEALERKVLTETGSYVDEGTNDIHMVKECTRGIVTLRCIKI